MFCIINLNTMEDILEYDDTGEIVTGVKNKDVTSIVIPEGVTSIGERAFEECYFLTSIDIPDSVSSIGEEAFHYCLLQPICSPDIIIRMNIFQELDWLNQGS